MALKNSFGCLWTLGLCLVVTKSVKVPSNTDPHFIKECLNTHNELRGKVKPPAANMKEMVWDKGLARMAKSWANQCKFSHNPCSSKRYECYELFDFVGENLWQGGITNFSPKNPITSWFNETRFYNIDNMTCSSVCGHYTQVVWANSHSLGCAVKNCPNLGTISTALFVCNYGPAGNFLNIPPYKQGKSCSLCLEGEKCVANLCENKNGKTPLWTNYHLLSLCFMLQRIF